MTIIYQESVLDSRNDTASSSLTIASTDFTSGGTGGRPTTGDTLVVIGSCEPTAWMTDSQTDFVHVGHGRQSEASYWLGYRIATGSEPATYSVAASANVQMQSILMRFTGCDSTNPVHTFTETAAPSLWGSAHAIEQLHIYRTPTYLVMLVAGGYAPSVWPSGFTARDALNVVGHKTDTATKAQTGTVPNGTGVFSYTLTGGNENHGGIIALQETSGAI